MKSTTSFGTRLVSALLVQNMGTTRDFYRRLGFRLTGCDPDRSIPTWAEVQRDSVMLRFRTEAPAGTPPTPICSGAFYLYPESVVALAEELRGKLDFAWGPAVMPYGMREFGIQDPNGCYLAFTEPV